ncbi:hypothetical protein CHCC14821_0649 [Bacillus paralicheniformis]|nr:hypothetical protein CHCC14821_0649 [Bacillus paralicheniformis]
MIQTFLKLCFFLFEARLAEEGEHIDFVFFNLNRVKQR